MSRVSLVPSVPQPNIRDTHGTVSLPSRMAPKAGSRRRTTTVKSGCSTCKSRKVKCDEAFPACRRCVSTGRVCQGYGVWGGGGTKYQSQKPEPAEYKGDFSIAPEITSLVVDRIDSALFEWYRCRTATKIPGAYFSDFWTVLLPQASHTEPAVLHAVLALSATHWDGSKEWNLCKQGLRDDGPENMERLTLQHYNQAIQHLKTPLSTQAESSRRVALITCLIFIAVDLLRGHFATAQFHLRSGLKLLGEERISTATDKLARENQSPDRWISEVFTRLLVQAELFGNPYDHPKLVLDAVELFPQTARFASFKEAWAGLQSLTNATFALTQQAREVNAIQPDCAATNPELLGHQQRLRAGLSWWSTTYEASEQALTVHGPTESSVAFHVLRTHHLMGLIMVNAALSPDDEMIYDQHTECFMRLLKELADIWTKSSLRAAEGGVPVQRLADSRSSIVDMGWIQPLYYTVTKCRIHRLRMQAIRCLEYSYHREGFWDSEIVARVSRQVMNIEEGDFYKNYEINDDFPITATATTEEMDLPVLPAARRIKGLEVVLSGSPMSEILLYSRQGASRVGDRVCVGKFDVRSQQWVDG